ncbi:hypothetical protein ACLB2K_004596 [Fragaria x ananassa]
MLGLQVKLECNQWSLLEEAAVVVVEAPGAAVDMEVTVTPVEFPGSEIDKMISIMICASGGVLFQLRGGNAIDGSTS